MWKLQSLNWLKTQFSSIALFVKRGRFKGENIIFSFYTLTFVTLNCRDKMQITEWVSVSCRSVSQRKMVKPNWNVFLLEKKCFVFLFFVCVCVVKNCFLSNFGWKAIQRHYLSSLLLKQVVGRHCDTYPALTVWLTECYCSKRIAMHNYHL